MTLRRSPARTPCPRDSSSAPRSCCSSPTAFSARAVEAQLDGSRPTIAKWRRRFLEHGVEGLTNRHRGRRPWKFDRAAARSRAGRHAAPAARRVDALVLPAPRCPPRRDQGHRTAHLAGGRPAAAPVGALHGVERPRLRDEGGRHHRSLPGPALSCRRVLHRREDCHSGARPAGPGVAALAGPGRAPRIRVQAARHAVALRGVERADGRGSGEDDGPAHEPWTSWASSGK